MSRWLWRFAFVLGVVMLVLVTGCTPAEDGGTTTERRRTPAPAPDPSAMEPCKHTKGCALLQFSWDSAFERSYSIIYQGGMGDTSHSIRWTSHKDDRGQWKGLFQVPVMVQSGDVVKISGAPVGGGGGLAIAAAYYLGVDLCNNVPGSHKIGGPAGCTATIP